MIVDKRIKVKVFDVGDNVMAFLRKERFLVDTYNKLKPYKHGLFKVARKSIDNSYMVALLDSMNISNTFNVVDIHAYQADEALYQEYNSGLSSSEANETDVGWPKTKFNILCNFLFYFYV